MESEKNPPATAYQLIDKQSRQHFEEHAANNLLMEGEDSSL